MPIVIDEIEAQVRTEPSPRGAEAQKTPEGARARVVLEEVIRALLWRERRRAERLTDR